MNIETIINQNVIIPNKEWRRPFLRTRPTFE